MAKYFARISAHLSCILLILTVKPTHRTMRFYLIILVAILPWQLMAFQEINTISVIKFHDLSSSNDTLELGVLKDYVRYDFDTLQLDEEGKGVWSFDIERTQYVRLKYGQNRRNIFISPGATIHISYEPVSKSFHYEGDNVKENRFQESLRVNEKLKQYSWSTSEKISLDSFSAKLDLFFDVKRNLLNETYSTYTEQQSYFYKLRQMEQKAFKNFAIINFIDFHLEENFDSLIVKYIDKELLEFEKTVLYLEADYLRYMYSRYVWEYFAIKDYGENWKGRVSGDGTYSLMMEVATKHYPQELQEYIVRYSLNSLINMADQYSEKLKPISYLLSTYGPLLGPQEFRILQNNLKERLALSEKYGIGKPMPELSVQDTTGKKLYLSTRSDKARLFDIWASWCGPCIGSFADVQAIGEKHKDKLEIVSISLDKTLEIHNKALKRLEVPGSKHYWAPGEFNSEFAKYFQIVSLPNYLLVSESGEIIAFGSLATIMKELESTF